MVQYDAKTEYNKYYTQFSRQVLYRKGKKDIYSWDYCHGINVGPGIEDSL